MEPRPFARLAPARAARCIAASRRWSAISTGSIATLPALHELDCDAAGFEWLVMHDADRSVFAWLRKGRETHERCLVVVNFTPEVYRDYRIKVPFAGSLARGPQHRCRASMAAAMSGTAGRSARWTKARFPRSALLFRPLLQFFSSRSASARLSAGAPYPLGATWDGRGTNFALFSANAEKVELCLFDRQGRREIERIALPERTEDVWHGYLTDVAPGPALRLPRARALSARSAAFASISHKLLLDPYAKQLIGRLVWSDAHFGYRAGSARADLSFDRRDNARGMLKARGGRRSLHLGRASAGPRSRGKTPSSTRRMSKD